MANAKHYVDKKELQAEIEKSHQCNELTPRAIIIFKTMIDNVMLLQHYEDEMDAEDCRGHAWLRILQYWNRYDYKTKDDPFAYFTSVIVTATAQQWNTLKGVKASHKGERFVTILLSAFSE